MVYGRKNDSLTLLAARGRVRQLRTVKGSPLQPVGFLDCQKAKNVLESQNQKRFLIFCTVFPTLSPSSIKL